MDSSGAEDPRNRESDMDGVPCADEGDSKMSSQVPCIASSVSSMCAKHFWWRILVVQHYIETLMNAWPGPVLTIGVNVTFFLVGEFVA
jgi:hypothetical protein